MIHLKLYEEYEQYYNPPKVGDYVVLKNEPPLLFNDNNINIMINTVGKIDDIYDPGFGTIHQTYEIVFHPSNLRVSSHRENIAEFGSREKCEVYLQTRKYNL